MKTILSILFVVLATTTTIAQDGCSAYYPSQTGKTLIIHHLNKKGRLSTISEYTVSVVTDSTIQMKTTVKDKREKEILTSEFEIKCNAGETILEPKSIVTPGLLDQFQNMDYTISGEGLRIPNTLAIGQELRDGSVSMEIDAGVMKMNMHVAMTNRKVIRKELITVPAGTFDCYIITYQNTLTMGASKTQYSTQWITKGIGMVKEETRKENGKLITRSVLQEIR